MGIGVGVFYSAAYLLLLICYYWRLFYGLCCCFLLLFFTFCCRLLLLFGCYSLLMLFVWCCWLTQSTIDTYNIVNRINVNTIRSNFQRSKYQHCRQRQILFHRQYYPQHSSRYISRDQESRVIRDTTSHQIQPTTHQSHSNHYTSRGPININGHQALPFSLKRKGGRMESPITSDRPYILWLPWSPMNVFSMYTKSIFYLLVGIV